MNLIVRNHLNDEDNFKTENPLEYQLKKQLYFWQNEPFTKSELVDIHQYVMN